MKTRKWSKKSNRFGAKFELQCELSDAGFKFNVRLDDCLFENSKMDLNEVHELFELSEKSDSVYLETAEKLFDGDFENYDMGDLFHREFLTMLADSIYTITSKKQIKTEIEKLFDVE